jgi:hypothetical protein
MKGYMEKKCCSCKEVKDVSSFVKNKTKKDGLSTECNDCRKLYLSEYYKVHKQTMLAQSKSKGKERHANAKKLCIEYYSNGTNKCICCGESIYEFLSLNHINGGGNKDRKTFKGARTFCEYLVKNNYPNGLNVMCYNCNLSYGFFGYCPHQKHKAKSV